MKRLILFLFEYNIVEIYLGTELNIISDIHKLFGSFVCLKDSMTMFFIGVFNENYYYLL